MRATFPLVNAQQAHAAIDRMWREAKAWLIAGHGLELSVRPARRSLPQNAKFHALCADLERSRLPWGNRPRTAAEWKVLLVSGHATATGEGAEIIAGLEGEFVNVRESTALMSRSRGSSLIEYSQAFCASHGINTETA